MEKISGQLIKYGDFYVDHASETELYGFLILAILVLCFLVYKIIMKLLEK